MTSALNILVAGGAGIIGTHMVKALLDAGHNSITVDNLATGHRELLPGGKFIQGGIVDADLMNHVFEPIPSMLSCTLPFSSKWLNRSRIQ